MAAILKAVVCDGKDERLWKGSVLGNVKSMIMRLHSQIRFLAVK